MKYKKLVICIVLSVIVGTLVLSSCGAATAKEKEGREILETWLHENRSGAEILSASCLIMNLPSRQNYLTDYIEGSYLYNGEEYSYIVDTFHGTVYSSEKYEELAYAAEDYLREVLNLDNRYDIKSFKAEVLFPAVAVSDPVKSLNEVFTAQVIPADITDISEFLHNEDRLPISIDSEILVSEKGYMSQIDLVDLIKYVGGIRYNHLEMMGGHNETLSFANNAGAYERWAWIDLDDFRIYGQTAFKTAEKVVSSASLEIGRFQKEYDYNRDVHFTQTPDGWEIRFEQLGKNPKFYITVDEDSEICRMDYTLYKLDDSGDSISCAWGDAKDGYRELQGSDGTPVEVSFDCDLLVTK